MTIEKVIQTLIDDYSKQAKLSKRERTIYKHGLLTGIEIGPMEEPEIDLEKELDRYTTNNFWALEGNNESPYLVEKDDMLKVAKHFFDLGLRAKDVNEIIKTAEDHSYFAGSENTRKKLIDKACEWLKNNWRKHVWLDGDNIIHFGLWEKDFRKTMEE